jgi:hypothetical protein
MLLLLLLLLVLVLLLLLLLASLSVQYLRPLLLHKVEILRQSANKLYWTLYSRTEIKTPLCVSGSVIVAAKK